ncbi:helix-turn-helix domain-containing protein [Streptomyces mobaraensis NBRC 13819 = DSM 40847]|uniref:DNA-binding protein n=1 Tax=Streptomyces mobaraensis (strain ATCC 29032 / DSM 40847 / JCM 4168 / NBRC 13819 / NCIMB 11159 / IPCR 16-22) TaxID=1223523 RepID=M2ZX71_STRM1|nr:helix-turn-helix transcriptional regulator [Streptomyces mobaraensis]EME97323.1 DNA-binding protein [Streptomyces mobaraensis NBRC 13819 = DSM 40847]QTT73977.1 helix-turn-helix domain-containing protein [Streptomyces mobaraensis NBRC 13819 = DSM 40847]
MAHASRRTARRRRLGTALREAREAAGISASDAAQAIHTDNTKISRIETGRHRVTRLELETLFALYEVADEKMREWLIALAAEGNQRTWWRGHSSRLRTDFKELLALESEAARITTLQTQVVPGLLQTREYATSIIRHASPHLPSEEVDFWADFRLARQNILRRDNPPRYLALLHEGVLRQQIGGPAVLANQLRHLITVSRSPDLTIRVVPFRQPEWTVCQGSFTVFSYPEVLNLEVVHIPYLDDSLYLEDDETVRKSWRAINRLKTIALSAAQSAELMESIVWELEQQQKGA